MEPIISANSHKSYTVNYLDMTISITGLGITSAIGQGKEAFFSSLLRAESSFSVMLRPGRQSNSSFIGAEIENLKYPKDISDRILRNTSYTAQVAITTLHEAWTDANLNTIDPNRIGLIIGGSNLQQRDLVNTYDDYRERTKFLRPSYGFSYLDTDLCGLCTEYFGIKGLAYTVGGASASGQLAIIQACQSILAGDVDYCIAVGALTDLSYWECQGLRSMGAMGSDKYSQNPDLACRPFDINRDGFIYGESCGAIVLERDDIDHRTDITHYAKIAGYALIMDANRNPNPSYEGEVNVIKNALRRSGISAKSIDYINPHGSGSNVGDDTELKAIRDCGLSHAFINTTKSITGHGLSAAGAVEVIATVLQMNNSTLHPSRNLVDPIDGTLNWVIERPKSHEVKNALSLSMGFGGINTAICLNKH